MWDHVQAVLRLDNLVCKLGERTVSCLLLCLSLAAVNLFQLLVKQFTFQNGICAQTLWLLCLRVLLICFVVAIQIVNFGLSRLDFRQGVNPSE